MKDITNEDFKYRNLKMLEAIIFDMDGVLVESANAIHKSFVKFFEKRGIDIQDFDRKKHA